MSLQTHPLLATNEIITALDLEALLLEIVDYPSKFASFQCFKKASLLHNIPEILPAYLQGYASVL